MNRFRWELILWHVWISICNASADSSRQTIDWSWRIQKVLWIPASGVCSFFLVAAFAENILEIWAWLIRGAKKMPQIPLIFRKALWCYICVINFITVTRPITPNWLKRSIEASSRKPIRFCTRTMRTISLKSLTAHRKVLFMNYLTLILININLGFPYLWVNGEKYIFSAEVL